MPEPVRLYLVIYDVSDQRRWRRIFRLLKSMGVWMQLSAFACRMTATKRLQLEKALAGLIDPSCDRVLIADLGELERAVDRMSVLGPAVLPALPRAFII